MPVFLGNEKFRYWTCRYFPASDRETLPPDKARGQYCPVENGLKTAVIRVCPHGKLNPSRIERSKKKTGPKKTTETPAQLKLEVSIQSVFVRCFESANNRGLMRLREAGVTKDQLEELSRLSLIEFRDYDQSKRPFIPRVVEKRRQFLSV